MADVVVLIPRRRDRGQRDRVFSFIRAKLDLELPDLPIVEGEHDKPGPFNRSAARNDAARAALDRGHDWKVAVFLDADTYVEPGQIRGAVDRATETGRLVLAFDVFVALTRIGTDAILDHRAHTDWINLGQWEKTNAVSSCFAITRDLWEKTRGYDERFEGWGFEDRAFFETARTLGGASKITGHAWHLWHPRSPEKNPDSELYRRNRELSEQYRAASGNVDAIVELITNR